MLVYFVNHSTAPVNLGGAERSMIALVEDWRRRDPDFEPFFLTKAPRGRFIEAIEQRGWPYRAFRFRGWALPATSQTAAQAAWFARDDYNATLDMIRLMENRRPDLVVTNTVVAPWGAFAAKALGIPHAWFVREYGDLDHGLVFTLGADQTFEDIGRLSDVVFINSLAVRDRVAPFIPDSKLGVVYPRIDVASIEKAATEAPATEPFPGATDGSLRVTMVGRLSASKGQRQLIDAIVGLRMRDIDVRLCLVGASEPPGVERDLRAAVRSARVEDAVTFAGEQANPFPYVAAADVCVTASGIEAFGRTTLEYLGLGKPVIAAATGGSVELVEDGVSGFLVDPGDSHALGSALERYALTRSLVASHAAAATLRAATITASPFSNDAAIDRLVQAAHSRPEPLPNAARYWFALPGMMLSGRGSRARTTARFIAARLVRAARGRSGRS